MTCSGANHRQSAPSWRLIPGDCIEVMATLPEASVDSIVCDPPYGLGFMGKEWDSPGGTGNFPMRRTDATNTVNTGASRQGGRQRSTEDFAKRQARDARSYQDWCESWAKEALRVLKPGGYILACGGTRTYHRLTCAIEDAGFEVRDEVLSIFEATEVGRAFLATLTPEQLGTLDKMGGGPLAWLYGSGFPKSLDVSKAIDKDAGHWRGRAGEVESANGSMSGANYERTLKGAAVTDEAREWEGWGTALKPAHEPICVARKSLVGNVAANVLAHGTGALNIDGCRVENTPEDRAASDKAMSGDRMWRRAGQTGAATFDTGLQDGATMHEGGRWPANVVLDAVAAAMLDEQTGDLHSQDPATRNGGRKPGWSPSGTDRPVLDKFNANGADKGGASRFLYIAKPDQEERNVGLHGQRNPHPTVKPMELMRWLCRLVTPPGGTVLDPFTGSGTTGIAALREGFSFVGIEREAEYIDVARARIVGDAPLINSALEEAA